MVFLDTSGLLAYQSAREATHETARALFRGSGAKLTTSYVLAELVALAYARHLPRPPVLAFIRTLIEHPQVDVVWVGEELNAAAMALLDRRSDKGYSLADAVAFALMRERSIADALTTDKHFEQEGFRRLLPPSLSKPRD
jgi:predicted nucleic acid-binding protein